MFNAPLPFKLVQIKLNKYSSVESYSDEMIFRFYRHEKCCIKYIVSIKSYNHSLLTLDFYPKINLIPKQNLNNSSQNLRYRMLTRQNSFGYIGGTLLSIMHYVQQQTNIHTWGFLAANLPNELTNYNNKRFNVYKEVLRRTFIHHQTVYGNKDKSAIFVIPNNKLINKDLITINYEKIFSETN
jgi:hypothetical protein